MRKHITCMDTEWISFCILIVENAKTYYHLIQTHHSRVFILELPLRLNHLSMQQTTCQYDNSFLLCRGLRLIGGRESADNLPGSARVPVPRLITTNLVPRLNLAAVEISRLISTAARLSLGGGLGTRLITTGYLIILYNDVKLKNICYTTINSLYRLLKRYTVGSKLRRKQRTVHPQECNIHQSEYWACSNYYIASNTTDQTRLWNCK